MALFNNLLYYPGCYTKYLLKQINQNYEIILNKLNIKYLTLKINCCAIEALESGYRKEFYKIIDKNEEILQNNNINKIITNCPKCLRTFSEYYGIKTIHVMELIEKQIHRFETKTGDITYFGGAELCNKLNMDHLPKMILAKLGYNVREISQNKTHTICCGVGGGIERTSPKIANMMAKRLLEKIKTEAIVTADPIVYFHLKKNATKIKVLELSEVIL
jgi:Fe-S oxidoreductase